MKRFFDSKTFIILNVVVMICLMYLLSTYASKPVTGSQDGSQTVLEAQGYSN